MAFGPYGLVVPDWHHRGVKALAPVRRSNVTLRREIIAPENLDVGIVKSAVADPADVLAGYVSKMWSRARNSFALDGLEEPGTLGFAFLDLHRQVRRFLAFQDSIDVARRAPIWMSISENLRSEILVVYIAITKRYPAWAFVN